MCVHILQVCVNATLLGGSDLRRFATMKWQFCKRFYKEATASYKLTDFHFYRHLSGLKIYLEPMGPYFSLVG